MKNIFIIGTGTSLINFDFELLRQKSTCVLNNAIYYVPEPKLAVYYDEKWMNEHLSQLEWIFQHRALKCEYYTFDRTPRKTPENFKINFYKIGGTNGLCLKDGYVNTGNNVCHLAINIALKFKPEKIILIGMDMNYKWKRYFYSDNPNKISKDYTRQIPNFEQIWRELPQNVEIINANPGSAINCFRKIERELAIKKY